VPTANLRPACLRASLATSADTRYIGLQRAHANGPRAVPDLSGLGRTDRGLGGRVAAGDSLAARAGVNPSAVAASWQPPHAS
jgi:hypothetical protein